MSAAPRRLLAMRSQQFASDAEAVWSWTVDPDRYARWFPGIVAIERLDDGPLQTGHRLRETVALAPGLRTTGELVVRECAPTRRLVIDGTLPLLQPTVEFVVEPGPDGTVMHWSMYTRQQHPVLARLVASIVRPVLQRRLRIGLRRLERLLDGASPGQRG